MKKLKMSISDLLQILKILKKDQKKKKTASFNFVALFVNSLFPLIDNFEIAIKQDNNPKEIESLYKTLQDFMDNLNIEEVWSWRRF